MQTSPFEKIVTIVLLLICLGLAGIIGLHYLSGSTSRSSTMQRPNQTSAGDTTVNVSVASVKRATFRRTTTLGAELASSRQEVSIHSTIAGSVTQISVQAGQTVQAGDALFTVDPSTAGSKYKSTTVTSPLSGTVYALDGYVGQHVNTSDTLLSLGMTGKLEIKANISERFLSTLQVGMKAAFTTAAWPDEEFSATVQSIGSQVNTTNRTVEVMLSIDTSDSRLKEGMFVKLNLITEQQDDVLLIPTDAITTYLGEPVVYIAVDGKAKRVAITTTSSDDNQSVVSEGLVGGEQLITAGSVVDGSSVKIIGEGI